MDWQIPNDEYEQVQRELAQKYRRQANEYRLRWKEARETGEAPATVEILRLSMWHELEKASEVETRRVRPPV